MTQSNNRLFDDFAKMMTDAAGVAQGMRREVETAFRAQAERFLADMDVVSREEFEAVKEMAARAREEADALSARVEALEKTLGQAGDPAAKAAGKTAAKTSSTRRSGGKDAEAS
ncbi:BMFP domain-containing protein YqiC [Breoghania corrubedonensis]|uniref:BMFP domain-containing protein YqiC n=1 Tax=Breoghania corrubedonensis TaxID=665038 RepID=A0A2T5UNV1_9HYPH|nr:accessory factor UbiK family protein [Breoghania corrubedonensis]PTW53195.1 BMFP domain-containing protein YqiC [Breoghania corrubedonensis]